MTTEELIQGKGRRVEFKTGSTKMVDGQFVYTERLETGLLMSKSPAKGYTAFYVRPDGEKRRVLVNPSQIVRFI